MPKKISLTSQKNWALEVFFTVHIVFLIASCFAVNESSYFKIAALTLKKSTKDRCSFNVQYRNITSNSKDLLLTTMFGKPNGHIFCIRSLRHTGSQCSVVVLSNVKAMKLLSKKDKKILEDLGVEFYLSQLEEPTDLEQFWSFRKQLAYEFLKERKHLYRRVISIDFYDTFFQNDPFCEDLPYNSMMLSVEDHILNQNNRAPAIHKLWPESKFHFANMYSLNGGTFGGGINEVLKFHELYMKQINYNYKNCKTDDQTYLDYYVYGGLFDKEGINYTFDTKGVLSSLYNYESFSNNTKFGFVKLASNDAFLRTCHLWKLLPKNYLNYALKKCN